MNTGSIKAQLFLHGRDALTESGIVIDPVINGAARMNDRCMVPAERVANTGERMSGKFAAQIHGHLAR